MFTASTTRPYTISAINTYKVYEKTGYITKSGDSLKIDDSKALEVVNILSDQFLQVLDAEDRTAGDDLEKILEDMQQETPFIQWIVSKFAS